jgi:hypothetical protein
MLSTWHKSGFIKQFDKLNSFPSFSSVFPPAPTLGVEIINIEFGAEVNTIILHLQIAWDDAKKLAKRRIEREQGRNDAADDLSELSEGEKEKGDANLSEPVKEISRINSEMHIWSDDDKSRRLYIVLIRYFFALSSLCEF